MIAVLQTCGNLSSFVGTVFWGRLADGTGMYKQIIICTALLSSGLVTGFMLHRVQASKYCLMGAAAIFSLFNSCTGNLIDSITVLYVKEAKKAGSEEESYGEQRLWASIGWGIMSLASGWLVDHFGINSIFEVGVEDWGQGQVWMRSWGLTGFVLVCACC